MLLRYRILRAPEKRAFCTVRILIKNGAHLKHRASTPYRYVLGFLQHSVYKLHCSRDSKMSTPPIFANKKIVNRKKR